jgi:hypothetical protein
MCERAGHGVVTRRGVQIANVRIARGLVLAIGLAASCSAGALAAPPTAADRELLAAADLQRDAPASFHTTVRVEPLAAGAAEGSSGLALDLWRAGDQALLRFTDARQHGKAYLQRDGETWFLAPGARAVRLGGAQQLAAGVSLQEIVGPGWSRDFAVEDVARAATSGTEIVTFALRATRPGSPFPRVDYVVRADTRRPLRIEYRAASGKVVRVVELAAWQPGRALAPAELIVKDLVGGRPPVRVRFGALEERAAPPHLFELGQDGERARAALG